jgi:hypothetical protein
MKIPLIKGTKADNGVEWRDALPVNMVAYQTQIKGSPGFMRTADGLKSFGTGIGVDKAAVWNDRFASHYRVSGESFIEVDEFGGITEIDTGITASSLPVSMPYSFNTQGVVFNGGFSLWDEATFTPVTKPGAAGDFIDGVWIDGYYILCDSENLWNTDIADETNISAINFAGSDYSPDPIVGVDQTSDNKLIVFNRYTTERFYNAAGSEFPFARIPNAAIPIGIVGTKAKTRIGDGGWVVLGGSKEYSPGFYLLTNSYQSITNREIDIILDSYADFELESASLEFRDTREQSLVICHLKRHTLAYDIGMSAAMGEPIWYQFRSGKEEWQAINGVYDPRGGFSRTSSWIYGNTETTDIMELDRSVSSQLGVKQEWELITPLAHIGGSIAIMEVQTLPGFQPTTIFFSTTSDGVLYGNKVLMDVGEVGDHTNRLIERRLGDYPNTFGVRLSGNDTKAVVLSELAINEL